MPQVEEAVMVRDRFPASEPPTLSTRGPSGGFVKRKVIVALAESHNVMKEAYSALDALFYKLQFRAKRKRQA